MMNVAFFGIFQGEEPMFATSDVSPARLRAWNIDKVSIGISSFTIQTITCITVYEL